MPAYKIRKGELNMRTNLDKLQQNALLLHMYFTFCAAANKINLIKYNI